MNLRPSYRSQGRSDFRDLCETALEKYLNLILENSHRTIKRATHEKN
jgi:transposase-like protein